MDYSESNEESNQNSKQFLYFNSKLYWNCKTSNIIMSFHVPLNAGFSISRILTITATKWFFPSMSHYMLFCVDTGFGNFWTEGTTPLVWTKVYWIILKTIKNEIRNQVNFSISILIYKTSTNIFMNFHVLLRTKLVYLRVHFADFCFFVMLFCHPNFWWDNL